MELNMYAVNLGLIVLAIGILALLFEVKGLLKDDEISPVFIRSVRMEIILSTIPLIVLLYMVINADSLSAVLQRHTLFCVIVILAWNIVSQLISYLIELKEKIIVYKVKFIHMVLLTLVTAILMGA